MIRMEKVLDDEFTPTPPTAERVAARALVLSAVSCRALIEEDAGKQGAEDLRLRLLPWLETIGAAEELEPAETTLIATPLGKLEEKKGVDASWQSEGMVVLAWALGFAELPPVHVQCEPSDVANCMGFLDDRENTPLHNPRLRDGSEIEKRGDTYLTLHWRLRQFSINSAPMDFSAYALACKWATMRLDELEFQDNDLAIDGVRIDKVEFKRFREVLSITQERHQALNWLMGFEQLYSQVTTDT
jgi:hypothetical protein